MIMDPDIARIVDKVARARERGTGDGWCWHRYILKPPLSEEAVSSFEAVQGVRLPEGYRRFVTQAGCGGAGPLYGLIPLDELGGLPPGYLAAPSYLVPELSGSDLRSSLADSLAEDNDYLRGTLPLALEGCGYQTVLIVSGTARGRVASVGDWELWFGDAKGFLEWYEKWIDRELSRSPPAWWTPTK